MSTLEGGDRGGLSGALLGRVLPAFCMLVFWGAAYAVRPICWAAGAELERDRLRPAVRRPGGHLFSPLAAVPPGGPVSHPASAGPVHRLRQPERGAVPAGALVPHGQPAAPVGASTPTTPLWSSWTAFRSTLYWGWVGYYLAGWYLHHYMIGRIPEFLIYLLGILGVVLTLAGPRLIGGGRELWYSDTAPGVALTAAALCALFRYVLGISEERSRRRAVHALGSYVFGAYLIHQLWMLLFRWLGLTVTALEPVFFVPLLALVLLALSLPMAWLLRLIPGAGKWLT